MKYILTILLIGYCQFIFAGKILTQNSEELKSAISEALPGDTILMQNGIWKDIAIEFYSNGTELKPVVLKAQDFGKVYIEGESYAYIWGDYLVIDGLIFQNGNSPKTSVISFKKSSEQVANNCRVTNCVIDGFSNIDRFDRNYWVAFYGKNNRLDHCYLGGKLNYGSTISVWIGNEESRDNYHRIDHNYFGHRPRLGSNGGETIRIGSSKNSMSCSKTIIEDNYFEHCNGETEIISIKACDNVVQGNTFYECEGSLVLRHGNRNVVRNNVFMGNNLPYTGGIRVIGEEHEIYNNCFIGLKGKEFRAPLVLMNGIPDSPPNRYFQVKNVKIIGNTWTDCDAPWLFGMGIKDEYETLPPANTIIACNNLFNKISNDRITILDDISGIRFINNTFSDEIEDEYLAVSGFSNSIVDTIKALKDCFNVYLTKPIIKSLHINNICSHSPDELSNIANSQNSGPYGYKPSKRINYPPYTVSVRPGIGTIDKAIEEAKPGAILVLEPGEYILTKRVEIKNPIKIQARDKDNPPVLRQHSNESTKIFFEINYGGELEIERLVFDGESQSNSPSKYAVTTAREKMAKTFKLKAKDCVFHSFTAVDEGGAVFRAYKGSLADSIVFENCKFIELFRGLDLDEEIDDKGIYNAENIILDNCLFKNVEEYSISFYRGGNDESTVGPHLTVDHCVFDNINNRPGASVLKLLGIQRTTIVNSIFYNCPKAKYVVELYGKYNIISHCNVYASGQIGIEQGAIIGDGMMYNNPMFENNHTLKKYSLLIGKAQDGKNMGLQN